MGLAPCGAWGWARWALVAALAGCGASSKAPEAGGDGGSTTSGASTPSGHGRSGTDTTTPNASESRASRGGSSADAGSADPLATGLTAVQTGVKVDSFDAEILRWTAAYDEPDPMIFKAQIYVESRFDDTSVACPNLPCGTPSGWTAAESGCYGLMQVVPACHDDPHDAGLLASGQPNLTTSPSDPGWAGSIFNPSVNIEIGISGVAGNRAQAKQQFPGCTEEQYTLMAVGNYNSYGSTKSCTEYNTAYDDAVLMEYAVYAKAAGYARFNYPQ
jgi:hypothetical protein